MKDRANLIAFAAVFIVYLLIAVVITFPLVLNLSTQLIGHHTGDAYEMGHHIWWFKYALQNGEPLFYQTLMAYPDGLQGISLWSNPTQFFPAWLFAFFMPVAAAYNVTLLLTMALNGLSMYVLVRYLLRENAQSHIVRGVHVPALFAGLVFMAFPIFQGHLFGGHAGLMVQWGVPLLIYALFNLIAHPSRRWFFWSVIFYLLAPSGHSLQVIYALMPIMGLFLLWRVIVRDWRGALNVVGVGVVGTVVLVAFLIPVVADTFADDTYSGAGGYIDFSTDLLGIVAPSFFHPVFGQLEYTHRVLGINITEGFTYAGIVGGLLAIIGAIVYRRKSGFFVALAVLTWLMALGPVLKVLNDPVIVGAPESPTYLSFPWAFVYDLPGFNLARTPGRFTFAFAVAVAVLAGFGFAALWARMKGKAAAWLVLFGLSAFLLWEYQGFFPYPTVSAEIPQAVIDLQNRDDVRAVMDMPWGNLLAAKHSIYLQTGHQKPLIAGQVTRRTPVSPAKLTLLESSLDPALLDAQNVDVVLLHKQYADSALNEGLRQRFGEPTFEDENFALFDVPNPEREPRLRRYLPEQRTFSTRYEAYFFIPDAAPQATILTFSGTLAGNAAVRVSLDDTLLDEIQIRGDTPFEIPVTVDEGGFYTLSIVLEPECPQRVTTIPASCPSLTLLDARLVEDEG